MACDFCPVKIWTRSSRHGPKGRGGLYNLYHGANAIVPQLTPVVLEAVDSPNAAFLQSEPAVSSSRSKADLSEKDRKLHGYDTSMILLSYTCTRLPGIENLDPLSPRRLENGKLKDEELKQEQKWTEILKLHQLL